MPRGVFNWTFKDVEKFLRDHGFSLIRIEASHHHFLRVSKGKSFMVQVQFHGNNVALKPRTLNGIILQSGISKKEWLER